MPKSQLFGPLNGGWTVAKRLMQFERSSIAGNLAGGGNFGGTVTLLGTVAEAAKTYVGVDEKGRIADPEFRSRVTSHLMESKAFALTASAAGRQRARIEWSRTIPPRS